MSDENLLTLRDCLDRGMVLSWWEAVAVTVEVAGQVRRSAGLLVTPDSGHVVVKPEGDVTILPGSPIPEHPVIQAARLMKGLLRETPAPPDLRDLVTQNLGLPPSCAWIEEFVAALSYFERPSPREILRALGARATAMSSQATTKPGAKRAPDRRLSRRST